jgi:hypothetical protein
MCSTGSPLQWQWEEKKKKHMCGILLQMTRWVLHQHITHLLKGRTFRATGRGDPGKRGVWTGMEYHKLHAGGRESLAHHDTARDKLLCIREERTVKQKVTSGILSSCLLWSRGLESEEYRAWENPAVGSIVLRTSDRGRKLATEPPEKWKARKWNSRVNNHLMP